MLIDSDRREIFLSKLGLVSVVYWGFLASVLITMELNMNEFRKYYWLYRLNILLYVYLLILIIIKFCFAFAGHVLRKTAIVFFALDIVFSYFVVIGLYFSLNNYL